MPWPGCEEQEGDLARALANLEVAEGNLAGAEAEFEAAVERALAALAGAWECGLQDPFSALACLPDALGDMYEAEEAMNEAKDLVVEASQEKDEAQDEYDEAAGALAECCSTPPG
jgi:tetratricopeptide (TPR) repeat protein